MNHDNFRWKKILLDTNTVSNYFSGENKVNEHIISSDKVFMSVFVLGELLAGFNGEKRKNKPENPQ